MEAASTGSWWKARSPSDPTALINRVEPNARPVFFWAYIMARSVTPITFFVVFLAVVATAEILTQTELHVVRITGTSNVHDWGAEFTEIDVKLNLAAYQAGRVDELTPSMFQSLVMRLPVEGISSKTRGLTGRIRKHLRQKKHPDITFELTEVTRVEAAGDTATIAAQGLVSAAGVEREVNLEAAAYFDDDGHLTVTGRTPLRMTSFDIKPPTAMFGTIKAADIVDVHFTLALE